jgi:hypothetical protein
LLNFEIILTTAATNVCISSNLCKLANVDLSLNRIRCEGKLFLISGDSVAGAENATQPNARWHNLFVADANIDDNAVPRLRICCQAACRAVFTICVSCDRGQRYCGRDGRSEVRCRQRHDEAVATSKVN